MSKRCNTCHLTKSLDAFYARVNKCKECTKQAVRDNYRRNRDHFVAYDKQRELTPERKAWKRDATRRHRERHPDKYRARTKVSNAVRDGHINKQSCACGNPDAQAHHTDYSKPLDVEWLCKDCHFKEHGKLTHLID